MTIEKDILLALLRLTKSGPVSKEAIAKNTRVPYQTAGRVLEKLAQEGFFHEHEDTIESSPSQRVKMAVQAFRQAADLERVCQLLSWKEFESIVTEAFEANGYKALKNFHFKQASKRWELDIIGLKNPLILCVDCKHWKRGLRKAATKKAVEAQIERTQAFAKVLPNYSQKAKLGDWKTATLIPIVMSLTQGPYKFYNDVPIVPVLQFQDFINEFPTQVHLLKNFHQKQLKLNENLQKFCK